MTSLAYVHVPNGKSPSQDYFWLKNLYLSIDFLFFCGTVFSTFGIQKDDNIMFYWRRFRTRLCAQRQLPKDGARRVVFKSDHPN